MNKRGMLAISQLLILVISIFAFSVLSSGFVSGQPPPFNGVDGQITSDGKWKWESEKGWIENVASQGLKNLPTTSIPASQVSSFQKGYEWVLGEGSAAPAGYEGTAKTGYTKVAGAGASGAGYSISGIIESASWAIGLYYGITMIGGLFITDDAKLNAVASGAAWGLFVGKSVYSVIGENGVWSNSFVNFAKENLGGLTAKQLSIASGILVAAIIFYNSYKSTETEQVSFTCNSWDAPTGGSNCERCNQQGVLPCSEYQCRSLGQACNLVNPGTEESKCVWINKNDVKFPVLTPWENVLTDGYRYSPDNTISPPDRGVKILKDGSTSGCVKAFEPLSFGIVSDEPSKCKIDYLRKENFKDMEFYFGGSSTHKYNHSQLMALPGPSTTENGTVVLQNDGNYELYVRCEDANGNYNKGNFVFRYCVEKGPDTTPVLIVTTNLLNGMPIGYNQTEVNLEVYVNEPAECRWSHLDQDFEDMEITMSCASSVFEMNAQMLYKCATKLTGLKNSVDNDFYFRCKDQPGKPENERNTNAESYEFKLIGTQPLVLSSVGPNKTIKDSTESIKVTLTARTDAGFNEGEANCYYSDTGADNNYIMFFDTNSYEHSQDLYLTAGTYDYWIKCLDLGGNSDVDTVQFTVKTDIFSPLIVRTFHEESYLKLITDEEAECVYGTVDCNYLFDDGTRISTIDSEHYIDWNTKTNLYVKCKDQYGNQPAPSECNMIIRAFDLNFN